MADLDDPRYQGLFAALYLGEVPSELCVSGSAHLRAASDLNRMAISQALAESFPTASFYGASLLGLGLIDGVARCLVDAESREGAFAEKVTRAASLWSQASGLPALTELFVYDDLVALRLAPYCGTDGPALRRAAALPENFVKHTFQYDVSTFAQLLERFRRLSAPWELVKEYAPRVRPQTLVAYAVADGVSVREVMP